MVRLVDETEFYSRLKLTRQKLGINQKVMATLLGVGINGEDKVCRWEAGKGNVPKSALAALSRLPLKLPYQSAIKKPRFDFIDLFAGIGGIRLPFQEIGGRCVFTSEWDRHSQITYAANFGEVPEKNGDITKFKANEIPPHDILLAGFPCQAFSQAGKKKGFLDTRGTMFFEIQRVLAYHKPKAFLLENVKQLKGHDKGRTLETIMAILRGETAVDIPDDLKISGAIKESLETKLEYDCDYRVLRARDFGVPQIRERLYIIGIRRDANKGVCHDRISSIFNRVLEKHQAKKTLGEILSKDQSITRQFTISDKLWIGHQERRKRNRANGKGFGYSLFTNDSEYCSTISARYYKDGSEILIDQSNLGLNPRKITPEEARSLQGFPENFIIDMVGKTQIYKQFGNSVAVPVIRAIVKELIPEVFDGF